MNQKSIKEKIETVVKRKRRQGAWIRQKVPSRSRRAALNQEDRTERSREVSSILKECSSKEPEQSVALVLGFAKRQEGIKASECKLISSDIEKRARRLSWIVVGKE